MKYKMINIIYDIITLLELIIGVLIGIAFITLGERKILGSMQRRQGPIKVGPKGILQSLADGVKLIIKENIIPLESNKKMYILAPILSLIIALTLWLNIPLKKGIIYIDEPLNILLIYAITSLGIYSVIYSGWASNSKYGYIGSIRSISQLLSYEISIGLIIMNIICINNSFNLNKLIEYQIYISNIFILFPIFLLYLISILAETLRSPFDIVESESELVAGNLIEYAGMTFALMYLAEYSNIIFLSCLGSYLFFGNYLFSFTSFFIMFCFIWIRGSLPRLRWDHLLLLGWTKILPFTIGYIFFIISIFSF